MSNVSDRREEWLTEVRRNLAAAADKQKAGGGEGRIAVRASAEDLNWLRGQLSERECYRIDLVVKP